MEDPNQQYLSHNSDPLLTPASKPAVSVGNEPSAPSAQSGAFVFISYRHQEPDSALAHTLKASLLRAGHQVFIDTAIGWGMDWEREIRAALEQSDYLLLLLSAEAATSKLVFEEVAIAIELAKQKRTPIILPIRVNLPFTEPLPYVLSAYLRTIQQEIWNDWRDTSRLVEQLLQTITKRVDWPLLNDVPDTLIQAPDFVDQLVKDELATNALVKRLMGLSRRAAWDEARLRNAYRLAKPPGALTPRSSSPDEASSLVDLFERMVTELVNDWGRATLLQFVCELINDMQPSELQLDLHNWATDAATAWKQPMCAPLEDQHTVTSSKTTSGRSATLMIAIEPADDEDLSHFYVRGWLWQPPDPTEPLSRGAEDDLLYTFESLPRRLEELYVRSLDVGKFDLVEHTVEFFLPYRLLVSPVHMWSIPLDKRGRRKRPVGEQCIVVVRSWERGLTSDKFLRRARGAWRAKWNRLSEHSDIVTARIFKPASRDVFDQLFRLLHPDDIVCYAETVSPPADLDVSSSVIVDFIEAGLPAGLWLSHGAVRSMDVYEEIEALATNDTLLKLPATIHSKRVASFGNSTNQALQQLANSLVLFWDDPNRLPVNPERRDTSPAEE